MLHRRRFVTFVALSTSIKPGRDLCRSACLHISLFEIENAKAVAQTILVCVLAENIVCSTNEVFLFSTCVALPATINL
jgi:hypothetical protein